MGSQKRVIIVEDSQTVRYEVKLILKKVGIDVVEAANAIGMFNVIEEYGKVADLIIMDLTLRDENGFDLIKKLRESSNYNEIPILVLTEHANKDNVLQAKDLGVAGYLKKPIKKDELVERVQSILGFTAVI